MEIKEFLASGSCQPKQEIMSIWVSSYKLCYIRKDDQCDLSDGPFCPTGKQTVHLESLEFGLVWR